MDGQWGEACKDGGGERRAWKGGREERAELLQSKASSLQIKRPPVW